MVDLPSLLNQGIPGQYMQHAIRKLYGGMVQVKVFKVWLTCTIVSVVHLPHLHRVVGQVVPVGSAGEIFLHQYIYLTPYKT